MRFEVQDTGIGIKEEDQGKLFKMYGKLEQSKKNINTEGVGLGLTISETLASLLNPEAKRPIELRSEVGKGTCFSFIVLSKDIDIGENKEEQIPTPEETNIVSESDINLDELEIERNIENHTMLGYKTLNNVSQCKSRKDVNSKRKNINFYSDDFEVNYAEEESHDNLYVKSTKYTSSTFALNKLLTNNLTNNAKDKYNTRSEDALFKRQLCLIVDDNPFNLMVAHHVMAERNYICQTALNGQEAIEVVQSNFLQGKTFDLILMDCQMPVMDGYEATRVLRQMMKDGEMKECPVIALTANILTEDLEMLCIEAGMSGHLAKPIQIKELEKVLKASEKINV